ncbi:MAG: hypothetical protein GC185_08105 [Alphaproteobacteria bacterium]|nr:hypothetical protein [Alphaproteobacteria bacterium]
MNKDIFQNHKRLRRAAMAEPPNRLKQKLGNGGVSELLLIRAQEAIDTNTIDFMPLARALVELLGDAVADVAGAGERGEEAIGELLYPTMQLRAQGTMFHLPLVTELADVAVNFLETVEEADDDVLEIVGAHKAAIALVLKNDIKADSNEGTALHTELLHSCERYYRKHEIQQEHG